MELVGSKEKLYCTGCTACQSSCPVGAISMVEDENGFLYPYIDEKLCIYCENCVKICPQRNVSNQSLLSENPMEMFAMKHKNQILHQTSQSGGVFYALAQKELEYGGTVFGAAFVENFMVAHILVDQEADLYKLQGSKYVQSDMRDVIKQIKSLLESNCKVLFCGTPCQCAGVKKACENHREKLLLVDLICHGVPSKKLWNDFLTYTAKRHNGKVTKAVFRIMDGSCKGHVERIMVNEKEYKSTTYGQLYHSHMFLRASCDHCSYKSYHRVGDLTLGDWIYGRMSGADFWDRTGVSQVLVNTIKGQKYLNEIINSFYVLPLKYEECMQPPLVENYICPAKKQKIQQIYRDKGFQIIARRYGHENRILKAKRIAMRIKKKLKQCI